MPFAPKSADAYTRDILGVWYALTGGMDITEGSPDAILARALGLVLEQLDSRLRSIQAAHGLNARGADLDERVAEIMAGIAVQRGPATAASGPVMQFSREDAVATVTLTAGAQIRSRVNRALIYRLDETIDLVPGQFVYPGPDQTPARVTCLTPGRVGNLAALTALSDIVPGTGIPAGIEASNIAELGGGEDEEGDESLAQRAQLFLGSLARSQPKAIEALAARFVSSGGVQIRQAKMREIPAAPGLAELVVSDGFGLAGFDRQAQWFTGTAGPLGTRTITFDGPAASEPRFILDPDPLRPLETQGTLASLIPNTVVIHERGVIEFINGAAIPAGSSWAVGNHRVYTGPIAELQARIEGSYASGQEIDYGWRAAGCRVRVRRAIPTVLELTIRARFRPGVNVTAARGVLNGVIADFLAARDIGEPFSRFRLTDEVAKMIDLVDFELLAPADNLAPPSDRHQFVISPSSVTYV